MITSIDLDHMELLGSTREDQLVNAAGVLAALTAMRDKLSVTAQAVRNGLAFVELAGRFQIIPGQPNLVLDVAHKMSMVPSALLNMPGVRSPTA